MGKDAVEIIQRLRHEGHQAYLVGGCVRDMVMGRAPKDYDVTTGATPDQVLRLFPDALTVGAQFGVVIVPHEAGNVEVATFRSDGVYADGRHPHEVRYAQTAAGRCAAAGLHHQRLALRPARVTRCWITWAGRPTSAPAACGPSAIP